MKYTYLILIAIACFGCTSTQKPSGQNTPEAQLPYIIDLSDVEYSESPQLLSDFVESIEYIKLSEEPLVPDAKLLHLEEDRNKNLYVDFSDNIYKYTPTGNYVKSLLKQGQGPGEVAQKTGKSVFNMDKDYVLVSDYGKLDYCKFTLNGIFIGMEHKHAGMVSKDIFAFWKNTELYHYVRNAPYEQHSKVNKDSLHFFAVRDLSTNSVIFKLKNHHFDVKGEVNGYSIHNPSAPAYRGVINDSLLWIKAINVDTIFCTTNWKDLRPLYIIKQHKDAAGYDWLTVLDAGINNYSMSEIFNKRKLSSICALKTGLLYSYLETKEKEGTGFCPVNEKAKAFSKVFINDVDEYCPPLISQNTYIKITCFKKMAIFIY